MAVVTGSTTAITAMDASGTKSAVVGQPEHVIVGTLELASGDSIASVYRLLRLPGHFRLTALELSSDAITDGAADVGVYQIAANGGAVVDADEFASGVSLATAQDKTNVMHEAAATDIAKAGQRLWERIGLTADPGRSYDIALTLTAATAAAGTVTLVARGYTA